MQVSTRVSTEYDQYNESSSQSQKELPNDTLVTKLRTDEEEEKRANKALADFLEPTIIALKNGEVADKSFDEIVKEGKEKVKRRRRLTMSCVVMQ